MTAKQLKQHARYERKVARAEASEEAWLRFIHKSFTVKGTPYEANHAARIVGQGAQWDGLSFHEELYALYYLAKHPGRGLKW